LQAKVDDSIRTLKLEVDMASRQVRGAVADKEKALVDHDVMKLVSGSDLRMGSFSAFMITCLRGIAYFNWFKTSLFHKLMIMHKMYS
jgi:hypothetical protein